VRKAAIEGSANGSTQSRVEKSVSGRPGLTGKLSRA
jgi:hypothetical protein